MNRVGQTVWMAHGEMGNHPADFDAEFRTTRREAVIDSETINGTAGGIIKQVELGNLEVVTPLEVLAM